MSKQRRPNYVEVVFLDSHLNPYKLNEFVNSVLNNGGSMSNQRYSTERIIGLDIPLEGNNRTKRLYIHIGDDSVKFRYHPTKERRFEPYREAVTRVEEMLDGGERKRLKAEGTAYDSSLTPLIVDLT